MKKVYADAITASVSCVGALCSLPVLDSTRLLAKYAVKEAVDDGPLNSAHGWVQLAS